MKSTTVLRLCAAQIAVIALASLLSQAAFADDGDSYLQSAHQLEKANDWRGAEIQLRNAAQSEPGNGQIRLELAQAYLKLGNPNAAEAEVFAAHLRGVKEDATAPFMAQAMLELGETGDLLKRVPAGNRPARSESLVRSYRGMAELALHDTNAASAMFADAERLDPRSPIPLVGEARLLMGERQFDSAQKKLDQALKLDPRNGEALEIRAMTFAMRGNPDEAMRQLSSAIVINPRDVRALLDRANLETQRGNIALAEKDLTAVQKAAPGSAMALFLQASIDAQEGKFKEADAAFDKLRGVMSSFPPAYLLAAEVKLKLNQTEQAEGFINKFLAQAGDQPKAYELLGMIALKRGNLENAIALFEKATRLAPGDASAIRMLGQAYVAHGDLDKAKAMFDQAALKAPGNASLATERALADFASGDREGGLAELNDVFKQGNGSLAAGPALVLEALQSGRLDMASAAAQELVTRDPKNSTYQELLAAVRVGEHNYPAAESMLRALLASNPNLASARRDLAKVYLETNRAADARKLYEDRLSANPSDVDSMKSLADIAFQLKDDAGAMRWLAQAQARTPADPQPSLRMIAILEARKKWPDAIGRARALQAKFANDASVHDALAHLYFESGDRAASLSAYQSAVAKFPTSPPVMAHYAAVLAADKQYAKAADATLRAARLDPRSPELKRAYVALTYLGKGVDATLAASESVFGTGPTAALVTADVLDGSNNRPAAIATLEKWQAQSPSGSVVARLASLYQRDNHPEKGLALLETWTAAHPTDLEARYMLAQFYSGMGKADRALTQYEWLVTQRPDNPVVLNNLAYLYGIRHDPRARPTAEHAMRVAPASGSIADTLGWILMNQGDVAGAMKYLQLAAAKTPNDATIQYHYAVVLAKTGKADQARAVLEKLPDLKASAETLSSARALLASLGAGR